jgi:predicted DsbA family dithiol-disulfide isomerase
MSNLIMLEVFSDYVCPWCYLGDNRVKKLKENYDINVKLIHFPLHPDTPQEGRALMDLFSCGPEEIQIKNMRMHGLMEADGLPFKDRSHTYNSRLAQEVGSWADIQPDGEKIHDKFYEAYFVDRRNIGDADVILDVVKSVGLDETAAKAVIDDRSYKDAVDADWAKSHSYGVTGVPTFVSEGQCVVGAQPYEALVEFVTTLGAKPRS